MSELTSVRHSISKMRKRKTFDENEKVIVYDSHRKLSYPAVIKEILGTNNYIVDSDNGPKYVSGDVLSWMSGSTTADVQRSQNAEISNNLQDNLTDSDNNVDDSISVSSDLSEDLDDLYAPHVVGGGNDNIVRPKRTPHEIANLGNVPQRVSRLRSGRI